MVNCYHYLGKQIGAVRLGGVGLGGGGCRDEEGAGINECEK